MEEADSSAARFQRPRSFGLALILQDEEEVRVARRQSNSEARRLEVRKAAAKAAWDFLLEKKRDVQRFAKDLCDPKVVTLLPYPGISDPGKRPGYEIHFVGSPHLKMVYHSWTYDADRAMMVSGARGIGKSCVMRAFAWLIHATLPHNGRLVCIWNVELASRSLLDHLKQDLYFAYFLDTDACHVIEEITNIDGVKHFLETRSAQGEEIMFVLDGAQALDAEHWSKRPRRDDAGSLKESRIVLAKLLQGYEVIWVLTPTSERVVEYKEQYLEEVCMVTLDQGFDKDAMESFMSCSIIGSLFRKRKRDVSYYAGTHPLLLTLLEDSCAFVAAKKLGISRCEGMSKAEVASWLDDDEDWDNVLIVFMEHELISSIKTSVNSTLQLRPGQTYHTTESMISLDARYSLNKEEYCSPFIEQLYTEVFRNKEDLLLLKPNGAWVDYCRLVLSEPLINWSEVGWLVERLCADVISRLGINISEGLPIGRLQLVPFSSIPKVPMHKLTSGRGFLYRSVIPNFSHVDGVIFYQDLDNKLHFIGLQFTTSLERHMHSAGEFMSYDIVKEWLRGVEIGEWTLHFAFICLTDQDSIDKPENLTELRGGVLIGTLHHWLHIVSFTKALVNRVGEEVLGILQQMVEKRDIYVRTSAAATSPANASVAALSRKKRRQLDIIAKHAGIDFKCYKTKADLIEVICSRGVLPSQS